jgi:hypothetical protein
MSKRKILVFDDQASTRQQWAESLREQETVSRQFSVESAEPAEFREAIAGLQERRRVARKSRGAKIRGANPFDEVAILVVDYDLLYFDEAGELTGESVAY